jgi:hypothetical protein
LGAEVRDGARERERERERGREGEGAREEGGRQRGKKEGGRKGGRERERGTDKGRETWRSSSPRSPVLASRLTSPVLSPARVRQNGWTGLIMAAQNGHAEAMRLLVEGKADINAADKVHTPLREALRVKRRDRGAQMTGRDGEKGWGDGKRQAERGGKGGKGEEGRLHQARPIPARRRCGSRGGGGMQACHGACSYSARSTFAPLLLLFMGRDCGPERAACFCTKYHAAGQHGQ